jgi:predicted transcriptional regulator
MVNDLEHYRGTFQILLFLHREGPATAYRMRQRLRLGPEAIQNCLNYLTRTRLARPTRSHSFPFGRSYELTDLGKDLVESPVRAWPYVLVK